MFDPCVASPLYGANHTLVIPLAEPRRADQAARDPPVTSVPRSSEVGSRVAGRATCIEAAAGVLTGFALVETGPLRSAIDATIRPPALKHLHPSCPETMRHRNPDVLVGLFNLSIAGAGLGANPLRARVRWRCEAGSTPCQALHPRDLVGRLSVRALLGWSFQHPERRPLHLRMGNARDWGGWDSATHPRPDRKTTWPLGPGRNLRCHSLRSLHPGRGSLTPPDNSALLEVCSTGWVPFPSSAV
jgi:hypothetical protein